MDESWRMRMGSMGMAASVNDPTAIPGRKSAEDTSRRKNVFGNNNNVISSSLDPEDFNDVFGGPPRSVLSRQFSSDGDFTARPNFFYQDIFQQQLQHPKKLPEFRIPAGRRKNNEEEDEEFYGDIFGDLRRSRSRSQSKSNSSTSVFSSSEEYLSPSFRPAIVEDVDVSAIASKLRPINVSSKWNSSAKMHDVPQMAQVVPDFPFNRFHPYAEKHFSEHEQLENYRTSRSGSSRRVSSPETIGLEPNSHCSIQVSVEDLQLNSPSSVASLFHDQKTDANIYKDQATQEQSMEQEEEEEEEEEDYEIMSSYVIEINFDNRERTGEALGIDEAIAWAKEKCQGRSSEKEWCMDKNEKLDPVGLQERSTVNHSPEGQIGGCASTRPQLYKKPEESAMKEDKERLERDMELELLDEDVRLWSAGKEANIRLLLSTLHHILWPNSGWYSIPSSNLKESAEVKKAYQKARLCLHPDKLQQRGATFPQKYIAEKAFPILQDAWAAFISQDAFLSRA